MEYQTNYLSFLRFMYLINKYTNYVKIKCDNLNTKLSHFNLILVELNGDIELLYDFPVLYQTDTEKKEISTPAVSL